MYSFFSFFSLFFIFFPLCFRFLFRSLSCHERIIVAWPIDETVMNRVTTWRLYNDYNIYKTQGFAYDPFPHCMINREIYGIYELGAGSKATWFFKKTVGNTEGARARLLIILFNSESYSQSRYNNARIKKRRKKKYIYIPSVRAR